ncbi:MAG: NAD-dependent DNA ligase LigA, partial [Oscillospiraceae bacterium]|nr:NAD-dependent DNA ligase LigA [Oscillospiraceae bacterium]
MDDSLHELEALREQLKAHNRAYYELDAPTISDHEYDALLRRLGELETLHPEAADPESPAVRVGGRVAFAPVAHAVPLLSLNDVFSFEELAAFDSRLSAALGEPPVYVLEPKVDGLSVALTYRNGRFTGGATRGDGQTGEDVTHNLLTIENLPKTLSGDPPDSLIVRGEVYMPKAVFRALNDAREEAGQPLLANPRNAAAGSLRQLDARVAAERSLAVVLFNIQDMSAPWPDTCLETLDRMESWGFPVIPRTRLTHMDKVAAAVADMGERREKYPFDMDGAVVSLDSLAARNRLGFTARAPRWSVAYKYPPERKETQLLGIHIQVG